MNDINRCPLLVVPGGSFGLCSLLIQLWPQVTGFPVETALLHAEHRSGVLLLPPVPSDHVHIHLYRSNCVNLSFSEHVQFFFRLRGANLVSGHVRGLFWTGASSITCPHAFSVQHWYCRGHTGSSPNDMSFPDAGGRRTHF